MTTSYALCNAKLLSSKV